MKNRGQKNSENEARRGAVHNGVGLTPLEPQTHAEEAKHEPPERL